MLDLLVRTRKGGAMSELRSSWTPEQVQENLDEANEHLPEARTIDRFPVSGTASGIDVRAGEDLDEQDTAARGDSGGELRMPPDPPKHFRDQGGRG